MSRKKFFFVYFHGHKTLFLNSRVQFVFQRFLSFVVSDSKPILDKFIKLNRLYTTYK